MVNENPTKDAVKSAVPEYEAPRLTELGTLHELTLQTNKDFGGADGLTFQQAPVTWTSP